MERSIINRDRETTRTMVDEFGGAASPLSDNIFRGAIIALPPEHHEIHCGDSYMASHIADLGNGADLNILIVVPNEAGAGQTHKLYHLLGAVDMEAEALIRFYESPTTSADGTALSVFNRDRNSANVDYLGIFHTPTITDYGTLIDASQVGAGRSVGGRAGRSDEVILKNNTKYILRITNNTTLSNYASVHLNYYVHPGV